MLDALAYDTVFAGTGSNLDAFGRVERWTIRPDAWQVVRRVLDPALQEFPRIDERHFGRKRRYIYPVSVPADMDPQLTGATCLYKHDMQTDTRRVHEFGEGHLLGEFVFVPASPEADEG